MLKYRLSMTELKDGAKFQIGDAELTCIVPADGHRFGGLVLLIDAPKSYPINIQTDGTDRRKQT